MLLFYMFIARNIQLAKCFILSTIRIFEESNRRTTQSTARPLVGANNLLITLTYKFRQHLMECLNIDKNQVIYKHLCN